ncbi:hypothetical protein GCM10020216_064980 [Nonomuraea helvata]
MQQAEALAEDMLGDEAAEALDHEKNADECHASMIPAVALRIHRTKVSGDLHLGTSSDKHLWRSRYSV